MVVLLEQNLTRLHSYNLFSSLQKEEGNRELTRLGKVPRVWVRETKVVANRVIKGATVGHAHFSRGCWLIRSVRLGLSLVSVISCFRGCRHTMLVLLAHVAYLPVQSRAVVL